MQKAKGSWAKVGAMTVVLCVCLGVAYGWHSVQQARQQAEYDATLRRMGLEHLYRGNQYENGIEIPRTDPQWGNH